MEGRSDLPPVFQKFPLAFHAELLRGYPRMPMDVAKPKPKLRRLESKSVTAAFYIYDPFDHLAAYNEDGKKMGTQMLEAPPTQCVVLSNGTVVTTASGSPNIVIETIQTSGEKQVFSLPPEEQTNGEYSLIEFPKNHVCVYRPDHLFIFDPLNPFTTHRSVEAVSKAFQQFNGNLYLWNETQWAVFDGVTPIVWTPAFTNGDGPKWVSFDGKPIAFTNDWLIESSPIWVSHTEFVHMSKGRVCIYSTEAKLSNPFPLKPYVDGKFGKLYFVVDRENVLIAQWPSWSEQSTQVRLTVFCTKRTEEPTVIYENLNWFNNQRVGLTPMNDIIGGFKWPFLQTNMMNGLEIQILNLETNRLLCSFSSSDVVRTAFLGDSLAILQTDRDVDIVKLKKDTNRDLNLQRGQLFLPKFQDALHPPTPFASPPITPEIKEPLKEVPKEIVVKEPVSETMVIKEAPKEVSDHKVPLEPMPEALTEVNPSKSTLASPPDSTTTPTATSESYCVIC